ncbi:hypothetical protein [Streptomyces sp. N35]|uniref:hypothetical protein n=1 Tax=Streptomyces sp. N35 TaxID=2795730 RepID=UPI0018F5050F|nr:hypothetical protein [Streptomyces sp. N35]
MPTTGSSIETGAAGTYSDESLDALHRVLALDPTEWTTPCGLMHDHPLPVGARAQHPGLTDLVRSVVRSIGLPAFTEEPGVRHRGGDAELLRWLSGLGDGINTMEWVLTYLEATSS